jgi:hypothetical protein
VDDNNDYNDDYGDDDRKHKQVKHKIDKVYSDDDDNSCSRGKASMYPTLPYPTLPTFSTHKPTYRSTYRTYLIYLLYLLYPLTLPILL